MANHQKRDALSKKAAALGYGADGWKVFPIAPGAKNPPLVKWGAASTSDPAAIRDFWNRHPHANIGLACGQSGIAVLDIDTKDGKRGQQTLDMLELGEGKTLSQTRMQRTPSGGLQYFYRGSIPTSQNVIGKNLWPNGVSHIDTRGIGGAGGYVLLPPSRTVRDDKAGTKAGVYEWVNPDTDIAEIDQWVLDEFAAQPERVEQSQEFSIDPDEPFNIEQFKEYLDALPRAIQGEGGELHTLSMVCGRAKDWGLSEEMALDVILFSKWNEECEPPWDYDELKVKIRNAYAYLVQNKPGSKTAAVELALTDEEKAEYQRLDDAFHAAQGKTKQSSNSKAKNGTALEVVWGNTVTPKSIKWIWPGHLALGQHTCVAGVQGDGKSQLVYALIAAITTGGTWPGSNDKAPLGNCVILSAEDTDADVLAPRLIAAGADMKRVAIIKGTKNEDGSLRKFNLQADIKRLQLTVDQICAARGAVKMISIDPISSYLGGDLDSHNNTELRDALDPIKDLAEATGAAVVSITHFNKASKGVSALNRIIGSIAFTAAPRAAFVVLRDDLDDASRLLLPVKTNLMSVADAYGMRFHIEEVSTGVRDPDTNAVIRAPRVRWDERDTRSADSVLNPPTPPKDAPLLEEATRYLRDALSDGPVLAQAIKDDVTGMGFFSLETLRRAREKLGVVSSKRKQPDGHGPWEWSLPPDVGGYCPDDIADAAPDPDGDLFA